MAEELSVATPTNKILINIYYPGKWVLKVNVLETATSHDVKKFIKDSQVELLYNGEILNRSHDFKFYGLKQEDVLVIIPKCNKLIGICQNLQNLGKDEDSFRESISTVIDPKISEEAGRIRDIQLCKLESKPTYFRKFLSAYQDDSMPAPQKSIQTFIPIRTKFSQPCTAPLPPFWSENSVPKPQIKQFTTEPLTQLKSEEAQVADD